MNYKLLATLALLIQLTRATTFLGLENAFKSSNSLPRDFRQMSKTDQFFEVTDKIIEALDQQVVPFQDLVVIACGGKTEQNCSQCDKQVIVQDISLEDLSVTLRGSTTEIVFNPIETERYICESSECYKKERQGKDKKYHGSHDNSWQASRDQMRPLFPHGSPQRSPQVEVSDKELLQPSLSGR